MLILDQISLQHGLRFYTVSNTAIRQSMYTIFKKVSVLYIYIYILGMHNIYWTDKLSSDMNMDK